MKSKRSLMIVSLIACGILITLCAGRAWAQTEAGQATEPIASATTEAPPPAPTTEAPEEGEAIHASERPGIPFLWFLAPICGIVALVMARKYYLEVIASDEGDEDMIRIASYVRDGAMAYLKRQDLVVFFVFLALIAILSWMAWGLHVQHKVVPFAFLTGGFFSGLCGFIGMRTATIAAHRTTAGARKSLNEGLRVAFRAGAVMGLVVVGFAVIDITFWFGALYWIMPHMPLHEITVVMLTFGMGASTQSDRSSPSGLVPTPILRRGYS